MTGIKSVHDLYHHYRRCFLLLLIKRPICLKDLINVKLCIMLSEKLSAMQAHAIPPCLSLIIPLQNGSSQSRKAVTTQIKKVVKKAEEYIENTYPAQAAQLKSALEEQYTLFEKNYHTDAAGLGIYVSASGARQFLFPFPVEEKIHLSDSFCIRELLYLEHYASGYVLLHINGKTAECYMGKLNELQAISDGMFPLQFKNDYEYAKPAQLTSHGGYEGTKSFEKDKSALQAIRLRDFYREADRRLKGLLNERLLIIAGPEKDCALFREVTEHKQHLIGEVPGNYAHTGLKKLADKCWGVVRRWIDQKEADSVSQLVEKTWPKHMIDGIKNVWRAAQDGKGLKLLVEKDYACAGFIGDKAGKFYLKAPKLAHRTIADAVDDIIKTVLLKNGDVLFADKDTLREHQHIALVTRY